MGDIYTDIERSIQQALKAGVASVAPITFAIFNNQVSKADYPDQHGAISIMKVSDVFQPANSGGQSAVIKTPVIVGGVVTSYNVSPWPDPFDLVYALTVSAETVKDANGIITQSGLSIMRAGDALIRSVFRPRQQLKVWDSTLNGGAGGWSTNYVNYAYAGYINRDNPPEEIYNRVTNIRFEGFSYPSTVTTEPAIQQTELNVGLPSQP